MRRSRQRGFTLVELMVVVVILGALVALVGPSVWRALFQTRNDIAKAQMENFAKSISLYKLSMKKLPSSLQELTQTDDKNPEPFIDSIPLDPWGNEYEYRLLGRDYRIRSAGDNGTLEDDDDIVYESNKKNER
jgi:general secretion pathway protein G